jgi:hypothetical protein
MCVWWFKHNKHNSYFTSNHLYCILELLMTRYLELLMTRYSELLMTRYSELLMTILGTVDGPVLTAADFTEL